MPPVPGYQCLTPDLRVQKETINGGFPGTREPAAREPALHEQAPHEGAHCPQTGGRAGGGARRTRSVGPFSFAPQRVGASIVPSDIQFDISAFLAVPQDYGTACNSSGRQNFLVPARRHRAFPLAELA